MSTAAERYESVRKQIAEAAVKAGRPAGGVRLLAVSKSQPAQAIRELYGLGQRQFGENYAQEMAAKAKELQDLPDLELVFIGTVQSNKLNLIAQVAAAVQSVGSERHARLLAKAVAAAGKSAFPVHLIVNAGNEETKHGLSFDDVEPLARVVARDLPELSLQGLMAIPPIGAPADLYEKLARLAVRVGRGDLSLGMSADLAPAVAAGSTCVRIGTALFGPRGPR